MHIINLKNSSFIFIVQFPLANKMHFGKQRSIKHVIICTLHATNKCKKRAVWPTALSLRLCYQQSVPQSKLCCFTTEEIWWWMSQSRGGVIWASQSCEELVLSTFSSAFNTAFHQNVCIYYYFPPSPALVTINPCPCTNESCRNCSSGTAQ